MGALATVASFAACGPAEDAVDRQAADQDNAVMSYTNKTSPKPVKLKVPSFSSLPKPT